MIDADTAGRIAIRLGRAFSQKWAKAIPSDAKWNWETAQNYAQWVPSQRPVKVDGDTISFRHRNSSTSWEVSPTCVRVECVAKGDGLQALVEANIIDGIPLVIAILPSFGSMQPADIWRADRAITSVCAGPWQSLHRLTPLSVIAQALPEYVPSEPARLTYIGDHILSTHEPLHAAMARGGHRFFTAWSALVTR
jgi:hypothetical protein